MRVRPTRYSDRSISESKSAITAETLKGSVKEAIGKLIGDQNVVDEGRAQQKLPKSEVKPKDVFET
ncbi:CsbD family protein [Methylobacterium sp. W2]|uniref:CsbD family protein n=1 Tax=Methylobacterium sp. W2 TaxID=2598107 RepID=UPI001D0C7491|nr:CsbD family protein [Methylobacterium sp. W2]